MSGIMIGGHIFRLASGQFGRKTAGSPLGALVRSVARSFARPLAPVHAAARVDDLAFVMRTPPHGDRAGFEGGCEVRAEHRGRARRAQGLWRDKARRLSLPLSEKGREVARQGAVTGVGVGTLRGRFVMLDNSDKLASTVAPGREPASSISSTPRLMSRFRGKFLHYGCATPFVAVAAASLSQAMHGREGARRRPLRANKNQNQEMGKPK